MSDTRPSSPRSGAPARGRRSAARAAVASAPAVAPGTNLVVLRGTLSSDPVERSLPSGSVVTTYEVTVRPGAEGADTGSAPRAESVPVAWLDAPAAGRSLEAGTDVVVVGRVRRRFFRSGGATASRTEVVAQRVVPGRRPAGVRSALELAMAQLADDG